MFTAAWKKLSNWFALGSNSYCHDQQKKKKKKSYVLPFLSVLQLANLKQIIHCILGSAPLVMHPERYGLCSYKLCRITAGWWESAKFVPWVKELPACVLSTVTRRGWNALQVQYRLPKIGLATRSSFCFSDYKWSGGRICKDLHRPPRSLSGARVRKDSENSENWNLCSVFMKPRRV